MGIFQNLNGCASPQAFADKLRDASFSFYGAPLRAYLQRPTADLEGARCFVRREMLVPGLAICPGDAGGQVTRTARRFCLVAAAGELAIHMGILPWQKEEAYRGAFACFAAWLEQRGASGAAEQAEVLNKVRRFFEANGA